MFLRMNTHPLRPPPASGPLRLAERRNEFEHAVFLALYNSSHQRLHRAIACLILGLKHGVRGLLFSWPLYLLPLAATLLQATYLPLIIMLLLPGLAVSGVILLRGVREDYMRFVAGCILKPGYPARLLAPTGTHP
jgi:hypothetical protein